MILVLRSIAIAVFFVVVSAMRADAQTCDGRTELRIDQENYLALTDRVYVYVPDIASLGSSGGWQAFNVRLLSSRYRKPLLLSRAFLKEKDLQSVLSSRRDIRQATIAVPGFDPRKSRTPDLGVPAALPNGEKPGSITVRVSRIVPVSRGTDHLFVVCSVK